MRADHYQLMRAKAIVRFWTLVFCLACFLDEHRTRLREQQPERHFTPAILAETCKPFISAIF